MPQFDAFSAYLRFVVMLAAGLAAFSVLVSMVIDNLFTEYSLRDYRRARLLSKNVEVDARELDIEDISMFDLASQLSYGRLSKRSEQELHKRMSSRTFRSILSA